MYGQLEKLPPVFQGGINENVLLSFSLEEITIDSFTPAYHGPAVVVRSRTEDSAEITIDNIVEVQKDRVKPFDKPDKNGQYESIEKAILRKQTETNTRLAHYLVNYGVKYSDIETTPGNNFAEWAENVLKLLPEGYENQPVAVILSFTKKGRLWTPNYIKGAGWGPFVAKTGSQLRVMNKHVTVDPTQNVEGGETASAPANPW